jgi:hypothetical protein
MTDRLLFLAWIVSPLCALIACAFAWRAGRAAARYVEAVTQQAKEANDSEALMYAKLVEIRGKHAVLATALIALEWAGPDGRCLACPGTKAPGMLVGGHDERCWMAKALEAT